MNTYHVSITCGQTSKVAWWWEHLEAIIHKENTPNISDNQETIINKRGGLLMYLGKGLGGGVGALLWACHNKGVGWHYHTRSSTGHRNTYANNQ